MTQDFDEIFEQMRMHGMPVPVPKAASQISVQDAHTILKNALQYFLSVEGKKLIWVDKYAEVGQWLENNEGRGLFLFGDCGQGKSLLCRFVIPAILLKYCRKVVNVYDVHEMNDKVDEVISRQFISLDDIGTEEIVNKFGNKRLAFAEIMDAVEKHSKLVIISTNLDKDSLIEKYGFRTYDRIIATTKRIKLEGKSLRK